MDMNMAFDGDGEETFLKESQQYMIKVLNRTLPFDENKAIFFIRGKKQDLIPGEDKNETSLEEEKSNEPPVSFGQDIKDFYDQVIQMPSSNKTITTKDLSPVNTQTKPQPTKSSTKVATISDMFKFVQDGNLDELHNNLLKGNHDINMRDCYNWSLLMCASCAGHMTIVSYLLENGAVWRGVVDRRGHNAADIAERSGNEDIACYIRSFRMTRSEETECVDSNQIEHFYCEICQIQVSELREEHDVSTLHQFNCQHKTDHVTYTLPVKNKGFQMMLRKGWDPKNGLGSFGQGHQYPVKTILKRDRYGLGSVTSTRLRPRVTHFKSGDIAAVKNHRRQGKKETTQRERNKLLQREKRWEIDFRTYMNSDY